MAFDEKVGDNRHVRLVVTPDLTIFEEYACSSGEMEYAACEETTTDDGADQRLAW